MRPRHWKKNELGEGAAVVGPEYFDDSNPWIGWIIDYFHAVVEISNIPGVHITHRTGGSANQGSSSFFTQAVLDVEAGLADLALTSFWVTSERYAHNFYQH